MKELIEFLAKSLVNHPEEVVVTERVDGDMGKVIGKQGKIAKAIRTLVRAASSKDSKRVNVEIVE